MLPMTENHSLESLSGVAQTDSIGTPPRTSRSVAESFDQDRIAGANESLQGQSPQELLRWAVKTFHPRLTMATAFGAEGCCIIHMLAEIQPAVRIFNMETGYQFHETLALRDRIKSRYGNPRQRRSHRVKKISGQVLPPHLNSAMSL